MTYQPLQSESLTLKPEVTGEPVCWQWRLKGQPWSLERTFNSQVYATTPDSEVRALFADRPSGSVGAVDAANLIERIDAAIKRIVDGDGCMRIPADLRDPDLVLADCKRFILAKLQASEGQEAMEKNAARYAWLREYYVAPYGWHENPPDFGIKGKFMDRMPIFSARMLTGLDVAIDSAIAWEGISK